jgi:hypothetical protein
MISEEFTGPLHFVQFWLNCIREYQHDTGNDQLIGLSTTKDVQDAILNDPAFSSLIDVIDIKYWFLQNNGQYYTPQGGKNLAPRQHARILKPRSTSAKQVYRTVLEYKKRFPSKAVIYSADSWDKHGWAILMAGGSLPNLRIKDDAFAASIPLMQPLVNDTASGEWILVDVKTGYVIYNEGKSVYTASVTNPGSYEVSWVNAVDGEVKKERKTISAGKTIELSKPTGEADNWVLWLRKK